MTDQAPSYVLLIMNCQKYRWKAEKQLNGWLQNIPIPFYHVVGDENLPTPYEFDHENHILTINVPDDYCSLPKKVIKAYDACHKELSFQYIFKTDDDQDLTDPAFFDRLIVQLHPSTVHYGGKICRIEEEGFSGYWEYHPELPHDIYLTKNVYCNGRFYVLSFLAVEDLLKKKEEVENHYFEDYAIGFYLSDNLKSPILEINNDVFVDF